ncbi:MAG: 23S rRNA (adenine(2503)-C(2))-methyltransferase RlmN [Phycisphaera sp.]|nr:MAG: 23S rRNA (adenine(2503)-C(2))-methyltransferase RlmN [Phycisphaera sp.]
MKFPYDIPFGVPDVEVQTFPHPFSLTCDQWAVVCAGMPGGKPQARVVYKKLMREADPNGLPEPFRSQSPGLPVVGIQRSPGPEAEGETVKVLTEIPARAEGASHAEKKAHEEGRMLPVESVVIPMLGSTGRLTHTLCVSSQVGCAMGCEFCETAQMGLVRNLTADEIVAQWFTAEYEHCRPEGKTIKNIVFMGMGEPLDNLDNVLQAISVLTDNNGPAISPRNVTISTVGRVDGLWKLREQCTKEGWRRLGIAISVNAPNDSVRNEIMPINRKWNMAELQEVLIDFPRSGNVPIMIEYVLIPSVNDADEHADELVEFVRPLHCAVNIIPYNPRRDSPWPAPQEEDVERFAARVKAGGVFTKRRRTKGRDQMAACGQLGTQHIRGRKMVDITTGKTG